MGFNPPIGPNLACSSVKVYTMKHHGQVYKSAISHPRYITRKRIISSNTQPQFYSILAKKKKTIHRMLKGINPNFLSSVWYNTALGGWTNVQQRKKTSNQRRISDTSPASAAFHIEEGLARGYLLLLVAFIEFLRFRITSSFFANISRCISSISFIGSSGRPSAPPRKSLALGDLRNPSDVAAFPTFAFNFRLSQAFPGELKNSRERRMPIWTKNYKIKWKHCQMPTHGTYKCNFTNLNSSPEYEGVLEVQNDERCDSVGKPNLCR